MNNSDYLEQNEKNPEVDILPTDEKGEELTITDQEIDEDKEDRGPHNTVK